MVKRRHDADASGEAPIELTGDKCAVVLANELLHIRDAVRVALTTEHVSSCDECPYGHHLDPMEQWANDPSEAYFSCDLRLGDNPARQWGEHAPCGDGRWGLAARIVAAIRYAPLSEAHAPDEPHDRGAS